MTDIAEIKGKRQEVLEGLFKDNKTERCRFVTRTGKCGLGRLISETKGDEALTSMSYRGGETKTEWWMLAEYLKTGSDFKDGLGVLACRAILVEPVKNTPEGRLEATRWAMGGTLSKICPGMPEEGTCIGPNIEWVGQE